MNLKITDRITVKICCDDQTQAILKEHEETINFELLSTLAFADASADAVKVSIEETELEVSVQT